MRCKNVSLADIYRDNWLAHLVTNDINTLQVDMAFGAEGNVALVRELTEENDLLVRQNERLQGR